MSGPTQPAPAVPYSRIHPKDFYRQLDWIRDEWDCEEWEMTRKLDRLEALFNHLPDRYYQQAAPLLKELGWCRVISTSQWRGTLLQLRGIVNAWGSRERAA